MRARRGSVRPLDPDCDILASTSASSSSMVPAHRPTAGRRRRSFAEAAERLDPRERGHRRPRVCLRTSPPRRMVPEPKMVPRPFFNVSERMSISRPRSAASRSSQLYVKSESSAVVVLVEEIHRGHVHAAAHHQPTVAASVGRAAEIVVNGRLGPPVAVDGIEARIGVEVPHVKEIAQVEIAGSTLASATMVAGPLKSSRAVGDVERALPFLRVELGEVDREGSELHLARRDVAERENRRA